MMNYLNTLWYEYAFLYYTREFTESSQIIFECKYIRALIIFMTHPVESIFSKIFIAGNIKCTMVWIEQVIL